MLMVGGADPLSTGAQVASASVGKTALIMAFSVQLFMTVPFARGQHAPTHGGRSTMY